MAFTVKTDTPDIVEQWPYDFQHISSDDDIYDFLTPFATEYRQIDVFLDELYEQRFLETATNEELDKLAAEVALNRRNGESDDSLRFRTRIRRAAAASDGTVSDITSFISISFEDKNISNIDVAHDSGHPVTRFEIPESFIDDIPLTGSEYEDELRIAWPAGFDITVTIGNTWLLDESGTHGIESGVLI